MANYVSILDTVSNTIRQAKASATFYMNEITNYGALCKQSFLSFAVRTRQWVGELAAFIQSTAREIPGQIASAIKASGEFAKNIVASTYAMTVTFLRNVPRVAWQVSRFILEKIQESVQAVLFWLPKAVAWLWRGIIRGGNWVI
ncbi:MAG TPA: hypothetical protein VJ205_02190, partial [Gammaproteobacteria bacterium]|nr:hypothetical protein [Gammaproteobacteria bacterium]